MYNTRGVTVFQEGSGTIVFKFCVVSNKRRAFCRRSKYGGHETRRRAVYR